MNDRHFQRTVLERKICFPLTAILEDFPLILEQGFLLLEGLGFHSPQNQMFSHSYTELEVSPLTNKSEGFSLKVKYFFPIKGNGLRPKKRKI